MLKEILSKEKAFGVPLNTFLENWSHRRMSANLPSLSALKCSNCFFSMDSKACPNFSVIFLSTCGPPANHFLLQDPGGESLVQLGYSCAPNQKSVTLLIRLLYSCVTNAGVDGIG